MTNFGYFSQAPSVNAGCPYTRPQSCIERGSRRVCKKPYVTAQAPKKSAAGESFRKDSEYRTHNTRDGLKSPGTTAFKQGSFQTGFRDAIRPAMAPFSSSSTCTKGKVHNLGKKVAKFLVGSQIPREGPSEAKGRPKWKRQVVLGDPVRLTKYEGDNYAVQQRSTFQGPCHRAQPSNLAPYKVGGSEELFEEGSLKGPIPAGGANALKYGRPQTADASSRPWKGSGTTKRGDKQSYMEEPFKELWKDHHDFKRQAAFASPFIGGGHTKHISKGFNGPHGRRNG